MVKLLTLFGQASLANAAVLAADGVLVERQDGTATSTSYSAITPVTVGYTSAYEIDGTTTWGVSLYFPDMYYMTTSGDYFTSCYLDYYSSTFLSGSELIYSEFATPAQCTFYTACSAGFMTAESTTFPCAGNGYMCATVLLYQSFGASKAQTNVLCTYWSSNASTVTSMYVERPAGVVSIADSVTTTAPPPSDTLSPGSSPTSPTPSPTAAPAASPSNSNHAGVIAGSVVGGLAVLALAGVATLWILRRGRKDGPYASGAPAGGVTAYGHYEPEKAQDVPEYNPHASGRYSSVTAGSNAHMGLHSPAPVYANAIQGGELSGVRSPVQTQ